MATKHRDISDENEIHVPKGFTEAPLSHGIIKNAAGELEWVPTSELGGQEGPPGTITRVLVADIDDPSSELNAVGLPSEGRIIYAVQETTGTDLATFYFYDSSNTNSENSPYYLNTLEGGSTRWVALGGKYKIAGAQALDGSRNITSAEISKLAGIESGATADQTGAEIKAAYEAEADTNAFTDAEKTKLAGVESGATADQTAGEIKTAYESNANTNAYTDAEKSKVGFLTVTQLVDLDTLESDVATNNAKVSNATHTGEVTGATALTVQPSAISNRTTVTAEAGDFVLLGDTSDSGNLKKANVSQFLSSSSFQEAYNTITTDSSGIWVNRTLTGFENSVVQIIIRNGSNGAATVGVRASGSALARTAMIAKDSTVTLLVQTNGSGVIQIFSNAVSQEFRNAGRLV